MDWYAVCKPKPSQPKAHQTNITKSEKFIIDAEFANTKRDAAELSTFLVVQIYIWGKDWTSPKQTWNEIAN